MVPLEQTVQGLFRAWNNSQKSVKTPNNPNFVSKAVSVANRVL